MDKIKLMKKLGWKKTDTWNNRDIYSLWKFKMLEHFDNVGIVIGDRYIYCNMNEDEIQKYTNIAKATRDMFNSPKEHTLYEYLTIEKELEEFVTKMKHKE